MSVSDDTLQLERLLVLYKATTTALTMHYRTSNKIMHMCKVHNITLKHNYADASAT